LATIFASPPQTARPRLDARRGAKQCGLLRMELDAFCGGMRMMGQKKRRGSDKIIHVRFGAERARAQTREQPGPGRARTPFELPPLPERREPVTDLFSGTEVCRLLRLTRGRLRSLARTGVVPPSGRRRGRRAYTFADLIALRTADQLIGKRVRLRDVAHAVATLRKTLPKITRHLNELRIVCDGRKVVVRTQEGSYEASTGQMLLDFEVRCLRDDVVRVLRPCVSRNRAKCAYALYLKAAKLDEDPSTFDEAEQLYRQALEIDPCLAIAYTNLGNICFRRNDDDAAEALYRRALEIDAGQAEAQYNLGYVMLERGEPAAAVKFLQAAVAADPAFADAYFNLAMAHEHLGEISKARPFWRRYVELEPHGTWAEIARKHL
jgi:DNA-binding transcriptional MerR regulator